MAYIDREKAIAYVEEQYRLFKNDEGKQAIVEGCVETLKFTPIADVVEVKHGEWIRPTKLADMMHDIPHCSLCGEVPRDEGKYCPNCGAKMDVSKMEITTSGGKT